MPKQHKRPLGVNKHMPGTTPRQRARSLKSAPVRGAPKRAAYGLPLETIVGQIELASRALFGDNGPEVGKRLMGTDSTARKSFPLTTGLLDYFPDACCAVSEVSHYGNEKHNPGQPMHHARGKSNDHADCIGRHLLERGGFDGPIRHSAALAWRALALLQEELEAEGLCTLPRGAKLPPQ